MAKANEMQVGGNHYKNAQAFEHWDLVAITGMGYFEGQVSRYVARWRKKDGLKDLQKALHYINKMMEFWDSRPGTLPAPAAVQKGVARFAYANGLTGTEEHIILGIASWATVPDLRTVRDYLLLLMDVADPAKPTPATDSNKHGLADPLGR